MSKIMKQLEEAASQNPQRLVYPEGEEIEVIKAANYVEKKNLAYPLLIGDKEKIQALAKENQISMDNITIIPPANPATIEKMAKNYKDSGGILSKRGITRKLASPLYYGAMMVREGRVDGMVAGINHSTAEVILAGQTIIGLEEGIETPSSIFLMEIPGFDGPEGELIVFADCGVCLNPTSQELADIAITSAETVKALLGWEPRLAMLSFSTKGSTEHEDVEKVTRALEIVKKRKPDLKIDGELQLDAAISPAVAAKKVPGSKEVAGKANILIFPDLDAGNISYKAVQRFTGGNAYGPFLQGFAGTISDLSRGSSREDIIGVSIMASLKAQYSNDNKIYQLLYSEN